VRLPVVLLLLALALPAVASAQDNETATNETADANETPGTNETPPEDEPPAPAAPITITLTAHQEGGVYYFQIEGDSARNPTLTVAPGQQVTFVVKIASGVHNLNINNEAKSAILADGEESFQWTAPMTPGRIEYWCDPHRSAGMRGTIQVGEAPAPGGGGDEGEITGETIDLGQYDPACAGRRAPAAAAEGIVGLPTLQDYIDGCKGGEVVSASDADHPVDYMLPVSWLLIGLGVVAVVWVHKYYKP
jgi:plastocyanin